MLENKVREILARADIHINGSRPWDIQVQDTRMYRDSLLRGSLGFGESYMKGWWDSGALDETIARILHVRIDKEISPWITSGLGVVKAVVRNAQSVARAFHIGEAHYDAGNDLYERMLDKRLTYTCGYWKDAHNLDDAQEAKLDLVCKKVGLKPGMRVLDIGCGWGSFMGYAAERYGVECVGLTVSRNQHEYIARRYAGLPVSAHLADYRTHEGSYDAVVSLGMFEHVGYKNYRTYMEVASRLLKPEGLFLLHTIGGNRSVYATDPWIEKYIFPNSMLPSIAQIGRALEGLFVMEDWHNFSVYYDRTLMAWYDNCEAAWSDLGARYNEQFRRMWRFYLLSSAATFRVRNNQLWQIVLSKSGVPGGYQSIR